MEPLTIFAATIGFIGAFHLLSQGVELVQRGRKNRVQTGPRKEWYCFFAPADLVGNSDEPRVTQPSLTEAERLEQRRRQQANRPRA